MVRRPSSRAYVAQWIFLAALIAVGGLLISTLGANLARRNVQFGFDFLFRKAGFDIPFRLIAWTTLDIYARALLVSLLNTILVSALGVVSATLLGLLIGIMRLSANWLVRNIALAFIEFVRNTPQLVQIIFWYVGVLQALPSPRQSIVFPGGILLNIRGLYIPDAVMNPGLEWLSWLALALVVATPFVWRLRVRGERIGSKALLLPLLAVACFAAGVDQVVYPELKGFNLAGGTQVPPELVALWMGIAIYASAFIAEIVRGSIEAIPKGQHEAALSIGLHSWQRLALVILPQALRIMVPQMTSQYLNIIKSSSLGAAIAYPEVFAIFTGTVLNQANKEIETILIVVAIFVTLNLLTSMMMNWYNRRVALVER